MLTGLSKSGPPTFSMLLGRWQPMSLSVILLIQLVSCMIAPSLVVLRTQLVCNTLGRT